MKPHHLLAPAGITLVAIGLAQRVAFFTWLGFFLVVGGFVLLALAAWTSKEQPGQAGRWYVLVFVLLAVIAALAQFRPEGRDPVLLVLTLGGPIVFLLGPHRWRLLTAAAPLVAAHAYFIRLVPSPPHQDVYKFLNLGVDALLHGHNPYTEAAYKFTYPPGVLPLVMPFRFFLGDIRWSYVAAEIVVVIVLALLLRMSATSRFAELPDWQAAVILVPLVLPRTSQAFYVFSNHEWLLLALALLAIVLARSGRWVWAGIVLGLGIASKQYFVVFPALFLLPLVRWRSLAVGVLVAAAITAPFLLWDADPLVANLGGQLGAAADPDRLTLIAALHHIGLDLAPAAVGLLAVGAAGISAWLWWAARRDLAGSLMACGLALAAVSWLAPFAAYNYYAYALMLYLCGLLLRLAPSGGGAVPAPDKI